MKTWLLLLAACGGPQGVDPSLTSNSVKLEWRAAQGDGDNVDVTLTVAGQELSLGTLSASTADGTPGTCVLRKAEATVTEFSCGKTSSYNYFLAELKAKQVIVSRITGVVGDPNAEERKVLKRIDVDGTSLAVAPYKS